MSDNYLSHSCSSECYFEYKMDRVFGSESIATPKLYFERDYFQPLLPYTLFLVPQEWLEQNISLNSNTNAENFDYLPYDKVEIAFDTKGITSDPLMDKNTEEYRRSIHEFGASDNIVDFYRARCRINITSQSDNASGVGVIKMLKRNTVVCCFFFVVNFSFKTKIHYTLSYVGSRLTVNFDCKERPQNIRVRISHADGRIPCLKNDRNSVVDEFKLEFGKKSRYTYSKDVGSRYGASTVMSVSIVGESASKYYVLHCDKNDTLKLDRARPKTHPIVYSCPYCHQKIDNKVYGNARYKRGGISCTYFSNPTSLPTILDINDTKMKNCLFCAQDMDENGNFDPAYYRLLPKNFMSHDSFKIAFLGSKRAGKTTFISRFFDVKENNMATQMTMTMIQNGLAEIGVNASASKLQRLEAVDDMTYRFDKGDWTSETQYYSNRIIELNGRYPGATETNEDGSGKSPFVAEINRDVYVSFYDVAGEDAQRKQMISTIAGGENEYLGVFCIVSGTKDSSGCAAVFNQLRESRIHRDSPVAVIVTKFDTLKDSFDSSCHCTRTDYFDGTRIYQDSNLQHEIDYSSEEIRSFLMHEGLYQDLTAEFKNVKFFGVSSFNFKDSIHHAGESDDNPGKVMFDCSASRMELPFIWMLNQFGVIK